MKKILSVLLALMLISAAAVPSYAFFTADNIFYPDAGASGACFLSAPGQNIFTITVQDVTVSGGDDASVTVCISGNPGIYAVSGFLTYPQGLSFKSWSAGDVFSADEFYPPDDSVRDVPFSVIAEKTVFAGYRGYAENQGADVSDSLALKIYADGGYIFTNKTGNGTFVTVTFSVDDIDEGTYPVCFVGGVSDIIDVYGAEVPFTAVNGTLEISGLCSHEYTVTDEVSATCTAAGYTERTCLLCGKVKRETVPAQGHETVTVPALEPTCTEDGHTESVICSRCGTVITAGEILPRYGHISAVIPAIEATCTADGMTEGLMCLRCGAVLVPSVTGVPRLGHDPETVISAVEPTCTANGRTAEVVCARCGSILEESAAVPATGHSPVTDPGYAKTCTADGLTDGSHCITCGEVLRAQEIIPASHNPARTEKAPTCTARGMYIVKCSDCGRIIDAGVLSELGHDPVTDEAVAPTCTQPGYTEGSHCARCNEVLSERTSVPATGHTRETETVQPDCTADGYIREYCTVCGEIFSTEILPAKGHRPERNEILPTCSEEGAYITVCTVCGEILETGTVPAVPHTPVREELPATCTEDGLYFEYCSVCGEFLDADSIPATGHSFGDFQFDVQPSAESAGQKSRHCENCGAVTEVTEVTCLCGDVNGDGIISSKDTKLMKAYLAGQKGDEFIALANADMNSDGMCTSKDIKALKGALV